LLKNIAVKSFDALEQLNVRDIEIFRRNIVISYTGGITYGQLSDMQDNKKITSRIVNDYTFNIMVELANRNPSVFLCSAWLVKVLTDELTDEILESFAGTVEYKKIHSYLRAPSFSLHQYNKMILPYVDTNDEEHWFICELNINSMSTPAGYEISLTGFENIRNQEFFKRNLECFFQTMDPTCNKFNWIKSTRSELGIVPLIQKLESYSGLDLRPASMDDIVFSIYRESWYHKHRL
jgi:hypothetical protein